MKEEQGISREEMGAAIPKPEGKIMKYARIAMIFAGVALMVYVVVMAAMKRYGG